MLSREAASARKLVSFGIHDQGVVDYRQQLVAPDGTSLWRYANLFLQPRNPMLYRVTRERSLAEVAVVQISPAVADGPGVFVTTGLAAQGGSEIRPAADMPKVLEEVGDSLDQEFWNRRDGSQRQIMAECLVPEQVPASAITAIYVGSNEAREALAQVAAQAPTVPVVVEPTMFFQPRHRSFVTPRLTLAQGDMFFSRMQTLTVSVNTVGVMGKGVASRAKWQFPDVYVRYQEACQRKLLRMGQPYLYKRETAVSAELMDFTNDSDSADEDTWFLLFATKSHWRQNADLDGIHKGLRWLEASYDSLGITSIAMPALGCGLGGLSWTTVGPLMCQSLARMNLRACVYLPAEHKVAPETTAPGFLLGPG